MSRTLTVGHLDLKIRDQGQVSRAASLISEALRTASFPGIPAGALIALRHLDLGDISLTQSPQSIAIQIDQRLLSVPYTAVHISHSTAIHASVVWAEDTCDALRILAHAYYSQQDTINAWFWPHIIKGCQAQSTSHRGLAQLLTHAAASTPDPFHGLRAFLMTVHETLQTALLQALDDKLVRWLATFLPLPTALNPSPTAAVPTTPLTFKAAAQQWGATALRSRIIAAICCATAGTETHRYAAAASDVLRAWFTSSVISSAANNVNATTTVPTLATPLSPITPVSSHSHPPPHQTVEQPLPLHHTHPSIIVALTSSAETKTSSVKLPLLATKENIPSSHLPLRFDEQHAPCWDGQPSNFAGAIFLIMLINRALPTSHPITNKQRQALTYRLARQVATPARDLVLTCLTASSLIKPASTTTADRQLVCRWLRHADKRCSNEHRLSLRQLVKRPGLIRATTHHIDVTFSLHDADIRIRRLGLDLNPGWVPWLGKIIGIHYQHMPRTGMGQK